MSIKKKADSNVHLTAIDLFSGAGGLSTGLEHSGIMIKAAVEMDLSAVETYKANHKNTIIFDRDIRTIKGSELLKTLGETSENSLDLLVGCPPCQGFSSLTFKNKKNDPRNLLVLEFLRIVKETNPKAVMLENVPGLLGHGKKLFDILKAGLEGMKYVVNYEVLQVADYGVPQRRRRLVLLAGKGFKINIPPPTHFENPTKGKQPWKTLRDAIGNFPPPRLVSEIKGEPYSKYNWNVARDMREINKKRIASLKEGASRYEIPKELRPNCHKENKVGFGNVYGRLAWDEPSVTITRGCATISMGRFGHPNEDRALSVREAATIQTFPKNYKFKTNSIEKACVLIGNAFPCKLATVLGRQIIAAIKSNLT